MTARINFVVTGFDDWPEFFRSPRDISIHELGKRITHGEQVWTARVFWALAHRNLPAGAEIRASSRLCKDSINVVHTYRLVRILDQTRPEHFIVCARSDYEAPYSAHFWIEQNGLRKPAPWHGHVNNWREPGLIPRDPERGTRVARVAFKGYIQNLAPAFRSDGFRARLAGMGVDLSLGFERHGIGDEAWGNYRRADITLAVRKMTRMTARAKPAAKLVNAWTAGTPALLGPEPAFREVRKSDLDYIEVRSPEEVLAAVARLRDDPELYAAMVANGFERAKEFTDDATAGRWAALLEGPVAREWERWKRRSKLRRRTEHLIGLPAHLASWFLWRAQGGIAARVDALIQGSPDYMRARAGRSR